MTKIVIHPAATRGLLLAIADWHENEARKAKKERDVSAFRRHEEIAEKLVTRAYEVA